MCSVSSDEIIVFALLILMELFGLFIFQFVAIGGIVDHHCLIFSFINIQAWTIQRNMHKIGHNTQNEDKKNKNTTQKTTYLSNIDPTNKLAMNPYPPSV
jgi:hypothetical protein